MAKTKQQKFTDSLRQAQINTFSDGLNMDLHPMSTPNTILTDCVNGTTITYNDNELVLQNERGNKKILNGDIPVRLPVGFIPVAMKEYNGILYIISYNPTENKTEIGTFPSPLQNKNVKANQFNSEIISDKVSYYSNYNMDVVFYDYSLPVSNYDKYCLNIEDGKSNPLLVLDHYVLDKQGNSTKVQLSESEDSYRFTHVGEGILGYVYRPYFLSSVDSSIIPTKGAQSSKLIVTTISDDELLWSDVIKDDDDTGNQIINKKIDDLKIIHDIKITLLSDNSDDLIIDLGTSNISEKSKLELVPTNWEYTYNLSNTSILDLDFNPEFTITNNGITNTYKYNFKDESIILMDNDQPTTISYNRIKFDITTRIEKDDYSIYMDHLNHSVVSNMSNIFNQESWFSKFQYYQSEDQSSANPDEVFIDFNIQLDLESYDVNYQSYIESYMGDATYKLHEIDENGQLKGVYVNKTTVSTLSKTHNVVSNESEMIFGDLLIDEMNGINYKKPNVGLTTLQDVSNTDQCVQFKSSRDVKYVQYEKQDAETYNMVLLDSDLNIKSTTNLFNTFNGETCGNDMEEYFTPGFCNYGVKNVKVKKNNFYLFELTLNIFNVSENLWKTEHASFIVVTSDTMLNKNLVLGESRMDEITLEKWFGTQYENWNIQIKNKKYLTYEALKEYPNNKIDLSELSDDKSEDEVKIYTHKFFLKYNPLLNSTNRSLLPSIHQTLDAEFVFKNLSAFNCNVLLEDHTPFTINSNITQTVTKTYRKMWSLDGTPEEMQQTVKRKYLSDLFEGIDKVDPIKLDKMMTTGVPNSQPDVIGFQFKVPSEAYATWINYLPDNVPIDLHYNDWLNSTNEIGRYSSFQFTWNILISNTSSLYGATLQLMKRKHVTNGLTCGEVKWNTDKFYPHYDGESKKIWMHGKHKGVYVLVGMDLLNDFETTNERYLELLKHTYYLIPINKKVYQYSFESEITYDEHNKPTGSQIIITDKTDDVAENLIGKIYPKQCVFIDNDYSSFNVQSFNNINYHVTNNINIEDYNQSIIENFDEIKKNYADFLRLLAQLLNTYPITKETLNEYFDNTLRVDFGDDYLGENDYRLFTDDADLIEKQFSNIFINLSHPNVEYDQDLQILYNPRVSEDDVNSFGTGYYALKWNYSVPFEDFWSISDDDLLNLNNYHSLLFYRYSSYANK